jgi:hypothetical protein
MTILILLFSFSIPVPHFNEDKFHGNDRVMGMTKVVRFIREWTRSGFVFMEIPACAGMTLEGRE